MKKILVSKTGDADYCTICDALNSIPDDQDHTVIQIKNGVYNEKVFILKNNLEIIGEDPENTIISYGDGARKKREYGDGEYGTFNTATVLFAGSDITVRNITIENTAGPGNIAGQSLAAYVAADRCQFENCRFIGYQDTIFVGECTDCSMKNLMLPESFKHSKVKKEHEVIRNYFKNCYICGDVDFIFGPNCAYFDSCEIFSRKSESEGCSYITAASTPMEQEFGLVFYNCHLTGDDSEGTVYLGRPWRDYAKTAFVNCVMEKHIHPLGWSDWGRIKAAVLCDYVESNSSGPGASDSGKRTGFSKVINTPALEEYYSKENVFSYPDKWIIN